MPESIKVILRSVVLPVLSAALTVLLIIPGNQGESVLQMVISMIKQLVGG